MTTPGQRAIQNIAKALFGDDPDIVAVYLFGSAARTDNRPPRDYDLALLMREDFDFLENYAYLLRARTELEERADKPVDVVHLNTADPVLQYQVRKDGVVLLERDRRARIDWVVHSRKRWFDRQPAHRLYVSKMAEHLQGRSTDG